MADFMVLKERNNEQISFEFREVTLNKTKLISGY